MALIDGIFPDAEGSVRIAAHSFASACYLWVLGDFTRADVIAELELALDDEGQLDQIKTTAEGLTAVQRLALHGKLEAIAVLAQQSRSMSKSRAKLLMGMT